MKLKGKREYGNILPTEKECRENFAFVRKHLCETLGLEFADWRFMESDDVLTGETFFAWHATINIEDN